MFNRWNSYQKGFQDGFNRGKWVGIAGAVLMASPLIIAGAKTAMDKSTPKIKEGIQKVRDSEMYAKYFNKDQYLEKNFEKTRSLYGQEEMINENEEA